MKFKMINLIKILSIGLNEILFHLELEKFTIDSIELDGANIILKINNNLT